ncbi:MAG: hypothetical protein V4538_17335 [Bacteroidota bacterium]
MATKEITPKQYAEYLGCTTQNVSKHLRKGNMQFLPDVKSVKKYSRFYLLIVRENLKVMEDK